MSAFSYQARDRSGNLTAGDLHAPNLDAAAAALRAQGLFPVRLKPARGRAAKRKSHPVENAGRPSLEIPADDATPRAREPRPVRGRIKRAEVVAFSHQLAVMIDTGVPISEAMACIVSQTPNPAFQAVLDRVASVIRGGDKLSTALQAHPRIFPRVMISLVEAAEASGGLGQMLERVSEYLAKERAIVAKARGALTYPAVMLGLALVIVVGLVMFILPRFEKLYTAKGSALPGPTQVLLGVSNAITAQPWAWLAGGVGLAVAFALYRRTDAGRRQLDALRLAAPVIGPLTRQLFLARATRLMGTLFAAGVPILDIIRLVRKVTRSHRYEQLWDHVSSHLERGGQLSEALEGSELIPPDVRQMILAGEKSGRLEQVLTKVADFSETEFDERVKTATQLLEPMMIVAMGVFVGFLALALLLPVFQASTATG